MEVASDITLALRSRDVQATAASLLAQAGVVVFKDAYDGWVDEDRPRDFRHVVRESFDQLKAVIGDGSAASSRSR